MLLVHDQLMVDKPIEEQVRIDLTESLMENIGEEGENNLPCCCWFRRGAGQPISRPCITWLNKNLKNNKLFISFTEKNKASIPSHPGEGVQYMSGWRLPVEPYRERKRS